MNLRKDHSHVSKRTTVNYWCEVLRADGDCINTCAQKLEGDRGGMGACRLLSAPVAIYLALLWAFAFLSIVKVFVTFLFTTFSDGCLGSNNDEGRSEV